MEHQDTKKLEMKPLLIKMLFINNKINHSTYKKVVKQYRRKERA
ncbi:Uncharacterised protein [Dorea longicatena]|jgi:hypothetical protein|uniref:Uncharacterized protein n=1 Tax=Dorea longicatena TaxID=88431 RepID=A0A174R670_9FIRM|nr:Uncharacterised protein [Dorea longicatena]